MGGIRFRPGVRPWDDRGRFNEASTVLHPGLGLAGAWGIVMLREPCVISNLQQAMQQRSLADRPPWSRLLNPNSGVVPLPGHTHEGLRHGCSTAALTSRNPLRCSFQVPIIFFKMHEHGRLGAGVSAQLGSSSTACLKDYEDIAEPFNSLWPRACLPTPPRYLDSLEPTDRVCLVVDPRCSCLYDSFGTCRLATRWSWHQQLHRQLRHPHLPQGQIALPLH